jgi:hypothetical protein
MAFLPLSRDGLAVRLVICAGAAFTFIWLLRRAISGFGTSGEEAKTHCR